MRVIAHRGNCAGPTKELENTRDALRYRFSRGWWVETDIRRAADGRFCISHDAAAWTEQNDAGAILALVRESPNAFLALNLKELGYEQALIWYLEAQRVLDRLFL